MNARRLAFEALTAFRQRKAYLPLFTNAAFERTGASREDRRLATAIAAGVLRWRRWLDWHIDRVSKIPGNKMEPAVLDALRIALFQMARMDRIPVWAAVDESVKLVPARAKGFADAVLRRLARDLDAMPEPEGTTDVQTLGIRTSVPDWIVRMWIESFGRKEAEQILLALRREPSPIVRPAGISREELARLFSAEGVVAEPTHISRRGLCVKNLGQALGSEAFKKGAFVVQGEASQLVGDVLDPREGERVLDCCAAPGGKTTDIASRVGEKGLVVALDRKAARLSLVEENARRLGLGNIRLEVRDAESPFALEGGPFDRVLVDAPCSGLGDLARHPESRWLVEPDDLPRLAEVQLRILENAASHVGENGRLVYAVCTLSPLENMGVVKRFLSERADFEIVDAGEVLSDAARSLVREKAFFFLPRQSEPEGFFACAMQRR